MNYAYDYAADDQETAALLGDDPQPSIWQQVKNTGGATLHWAKGGGKTGSSKKIHRRNVLVFILTLFIWCISISSTVYCNKILVNRIDDSKCTVKSSDLKRLYQYSILVLVVSSILLTMLFLRITTDNTDNLLGANTLFRFVDENFDIFGNLLLCIIFGIFAGFWGTIKGTNCIEDDHVSSMIVVCALACAASGLLFFYFSYDRIKQSQQGSS